MLKNYLKIAFRNLAKHKVFSFLNISGLAIAIGASALLFLSALWMFSFDSFHKDIAQLHRVYIEWYHATGTERQTNMPVPLFPALEEEFSELEMGSRWSSNAMLIERNGQLYRESVRMVDPEFFNLFTFPLLHGSPTEAMADLNSVVLTEESAIKVFGHAEGTLIGETLTYFIQGQQRTGVLTGIAKNVPKNSSLRFGAIARFEQNSNYQQDKDNWNNFNHEVYLKLPAAVKVADFEERLTPFVQKYFADDLEWLESNGALLGPNGERMALRIQPVKDIYFDTEISKQGVNILFPILLGVLGLFILLIACINFVNLSLGVAMTRGREVGVRKALGASRGQLLGQFWWESLLTAFIATLLGIALAQFVLPHYNTLFKLPLRLDRIEILWVVMGILMMVGIIAGAYPAWVLSKFQAAEVLKNNTPSQKSGGLRNALVVAQFSISILLICCTLVVWQQLQFMRSKPLGFNKEEVVSIPIPSNIDGQKAVDRMRQELASYPEIVSLTAATNNLGRGKDGSAHTSVMGFDQGEQRMQTNWLEVDYDYLKTLEIELVEGRTFSREHPTDTATAIIINESMAKQLGEGSAIGKVMNLNPEREVIGVVKDYHFQSLARPIEPLSMTIQSGFRFYYIFARVNSQDLSKTVKLLEQTWEKVSPGASFQASFLDENTDRMYAQEERMGQMLMSAGVLAIVLSCMGLLGISIFTLVRRTKEIGIRKILGASVGQIIQLISKEALAMVIIASFIAAPIAAWGMGKWLGQFEFSISLNPWVFFIAGAIALVIAFLTICIQTIRAALGNPVNSLRYE